MKICSRCLLNENTPAISFDSNGICSYCELHDMMDVRFDVSNEKMLNELVDKIRLDGTGKKYDCIAGISGGTDSSYALVKAKELGLRVLAVHFDNGWNSTVSTTNISRLLKKLNYDLYTYVVNWHEFKDIQLSFLKSSTIDLEIPTDLGINAVFYETARKYGIKYVLTGISFRTEGFMPQMWGYGDGRYIKRIQKLFGSRKIKSYPNLDLYKLIYYTIFKRIKIIRFLNYFNYSKDKAREVLEKEYGWQYYGGHHFESIYTRFFQGYVSPVKFGVDRRLISLSAQIRSGLIKRDEGLEKIAEIYYPEDILKEDKQFIAKKLEISFDDFENLLNLPNKNFRDYPSYYKLFKYSRKILEILSKLEITPNISHSTKFKD